MKQLLFGFVLALVLPGIISEVQAQSYYYGSNTAPGNYNYPGYNQLIGSFLNGSPSQGSPYTYAYTSPSYNTYSYSRPTNTRTFSYNSPRLSLSYSRPTTSYSYSTPTSSYRTNYYRTPTSYSSNTSSYYRTNYTRPTSYTRQNYSYNSGCSYGSYGNSCSRSTSYRSPYSYSTNSFGRNTGYRSTSSYSRNYNRSSNGAYRFYNTSSYRSW